MLVNWCSSVFSYSVGQFLGTYIVAATYLEKCVGFWAEYLLPLFFLGHLRSRIHRGLATLNTVRLNIGRGIIIKGLRKKQGCLRNKFVQHAARFPPKYTEHITLSTIIIIILIFNVGKREMGSTSRERHYKYHCTSCIYAHFICRMSPCADIDKEREKQENNQLWL